MVYEFQYCGIYQSTMVISFKTTLLSYQHSTFVQRWYYYGARPLKKHICNVLFYTYHSPHFHILVVGENENDVAQFDAFWTPERAGEKSDEETGGHDASAGPPLTDPRARHESKISPNPRSVCLEKRCRADESFARRTAAHKVGWAEKVWGSETLSVCHMTSAWYNSWYIHSHSSLKKYN